MSNLGKIGENLAAESLSQRGYTILGLNIRLGHLEVDIAASKGQFHYLFEVKTCGYHPLLTAEDYLDQRKLTHLQLACQAYAQKHNLYLKQVEAAFIAVNFNKDNLANIKYYFDIF